jgi:serine/threonine protein kinase/Tfp pilus assembly protein PilF
MDSLSYDTLRSALADRYAIETELGKGGMATVYLAYDRKHDRKVALKVLRSDVSESLGADRFVREIRLAARLNHPNILPVFDSGEVATAGRPMLFYVMPVVEGRTLRDRLDESQELSVDETVSIASGIAAALDYAHKNDVVHRDIKPENILLHGGHPLVADFGIGKALTSASTGSGITQIGVSVGTPAYMSPEQASGDAELDGRSDLYSLGCTMFEMLTGNVPFTGPTTNSVIAQRFTTNAPAVVTLRPSVPGAISRAVSKLLERDPANRFRTGAELIDVMRTRSAVPDSAEKSIAVLPFANMSADAENEYFSDGITEEIINALVQVPGLRVAARTSVFAFKGKSEDLRAVAAKLGVQSVLEGSVRKAGKRIRITAQLINADDGIHIWSERFDRELDDIFELQDDIARTIAERLKAQIEPKTALVKPATTDLEAYDLYLRGRHFWEQRGPGLVRALQCFEGALARDPNYALAYAGVADVYNLLAFYGVMRPHDAIPKARAAANRALEINPDLAEAHSALGFAVLVYDWDAIAAEELFRRAIALKPTYVTARIWLAASLIAQRRSSEAVECDEEAVRIEPLSLFAHVHLAWMYALDERLDEADRRIQHALEIGPNFLMARWLGGQICISQGRFDEGIAYIRSANDMSGRAPFMLGTLASALAMVGRAEESRAILSELEMRSEKEYVRAFGLAQIHAYLGDIDKTFELAEKAREERDTVLVYSGVETGGPVFSMGFGPDTVDQERFRKFRATLGINPPPL